MYDYVELFIDMIKAGNDMTDVVWSEFQEAAARTIYDNADLDNVDTGDFQ